MQPSEDGTTVKALIDLNKSLVRICNNIELIVALMISDSTEENLGNISGYGTMTDRVIERANVLKNQIRSSRRESRDK